jgi:hypothetical protein
MAIYSDEDALLARHIMERLLPSRRTRDVYERARHFTERSRLDLGDGIVISDVEEDVTQFTSELEFVEETGSSFPALQAENGDVIPVALYYLFGPFWAGLRRKPPLHYAHEWLSNDQHSLYSDRRFKPISPERAHMAFIARAVDFLATRIATVRGAEQAAPSLSTKCTRLNIAQRAGGPRVFTPGCNFTVSSASPGLRVFWSGAYWISPNYFNHPTSPISSVLQAGTYIFGVDGGAYGNQIQWDQNAVVTLPGEPSVHLNF